MGTVFVVTTLILGCNAILDVDVLLRGGNAVVLYASSHHDIPIVVNVSGRYKMDRGIEERLGKDYFERAKRDGHIEIKSKKG
ncbi:hypothetical protein Tco_1134809 [Tanacetum coccineum]